MTVARIHRNAVQSAPPGESQTGLQFPANGSAGDGNSTRFKFTGVTTLAPWTIIFKLFPLAQTGYKTTYFIGPDGTFVGGNAEGYVGNHPYPPGGGGGSTHKWETAMLAFDFVTDDNGNNTDVINDRWYDQAATNAAIASNELENTFWWDLSRNTTRRITTSSAGSGLGYATDLQPVTVLTFGDAPWQPNQETMCGIIRGIQIYSAVKSLSDIQVLAACDTNAAVLASGVSANLYYLNMNPTPSDITDKSGAGHNPAWHNSNRPTLWTP